VDRALEANGDDYNVYVPYGNTLSALGRTEARRALTERAVTVLEQQVQMVPEDTRARMLLAGNYATLGRPNDSVRELEEVLRLGSTDPHTIYNAACTYGLLQLKKEALSTLKKALEAGFSESDIITRDPDLTCLHDEPEFKRLVGQMKPKE